MRQGSGSMHIVRVKQADAWQGQGARPQQQPKFSSWLECQPVIPNMNPSPARPRPWLDAWVQAGTGGAGAAEMVLLDGYEGAGAGWQQVPARQAGRQGVARRRLTPAPTFRGKPAGGAVQVEAALLGRRPRLAGVAGTEAEAGGGRDGLPVGAAVERDLRLQAGRWGEAGRHLGNWQLIWSGCSCCMYTTNCHQQLVERTTRNVTTTEQGSRRRAAGGRRQCHTCRKSVGEAFWAPMAASSTWLAMYMPCREQRAEEGSGTRSPPLRPPRSRAQGRLRGLRLVEPPWSWLRASAGLAGSPARLASSVAAPQHRAHRNLSSPAAGRSPGWPPPVRSL